MLRRATTLLACVLALGARAVAEETWDPTIFPYRPQAVDYRRRLDALVEKWWEREGNRPTEVVATEHRFTVDFGPLFGLRAHGERGQHTTGTATLHRLASPPACRSIIGANLVALNGDNPGLHGYGSYIRGVAEIDSVKKPRGTGIVDVRGEDDVQPRSHTT